MNNVERNAALELDFQTRSYMKRNGCDYRTAFYKLAAKDKGLIRRYSDRYADSVDVKKYNADTLSPAQKAMAGLQADPVKCRTLAGYVVDHLAKQKLTNVGGVADPAEAYKRALSAVKKEHPSLAVAAESGFISDTDFALLAMLVPALKGEIERDVERDGFGVSWTVDRTGKNSTRCGCGKPKPYCRAQKLAHRRGVSEDSVREFAACIRDAQMYGDQLDAIRCYYR